VTPQRWKSHAHHWLILHGRYTLQGPQAGLPGLPGHRSLRLSRQGRRRFSDKRKLSGRPRARTARSWSIAVGGATPATVRPRNSKWLTRGGPPAVSA
jgi:hypothetical protein